MKQLKKNEVMVSFDDWTRQYINNLLLGGGYKSVSEIIREAIRFHEHWSTRVKTEFEAPESQTEISSA